MLRPMTAAVVLYRHTAEDYNSHGKTNYRIGILVDFVMCKTRDICIILSIAAKMQYHYGQFAV
jgi:hypothetical protein